MKKNKSGNKKGLIQKPYLTRFEKEGLSGSRNFPSEKGLDNIEYKIYKSEKKLYNNFFSEDDYVNFNKMSNPKPTYSREKIEKFVSMAKRPVSDKKAFTGVFKAFLSICFVFLVLVTFIGFYYNSSNPLIRLADSVRRDFTINLIDKNNSKVFSLVSKAFLSNGIISENEHLVPKTLINALVALHSILEDRYQKNELSWSSSSVDQSNENQKINLDLVKQSLNISSEKANICKEIKTFEDLNNEHCKFSYLNFTLDYILPNYYSNDYTTMEAFTNKIVHLSPDLTSYLVKSWEKRNFTFNDFLEIYFNRVYYGNSVINLDFASKLYFNVDLKDISLSQAVILIKKIYDNNKNIYPINDISYADIVNKLSKNNVIKNNEVIAYVDKINNTALLGHQNPYVIYLDNLINLGYSDSQSRQTTNILTTFDASIVNNSILTINNALLMNKIPSVSLVILKNNEIVSGYSYNLDLEKQTKSFEKFYPKVKPYSALKPFSYLAMVNANLTIPTLLLESKYQNLMFTFKSGQRNAKNISNSEINYSVLDSLTNTNLDVIPKELRDLFAKQLMSLEYDLFSNVDLETYAKSFNILFKENEPFTSEDIAQGNFTTNLFDLTKAYNVLANKGNYFNLKYLVSINDNAFEHDSRVQKQLDVSFDEVLEAVYFKRLNSAGKDFFYVIDFNMAFVYSPSTGYSIGLWLGDLNNQEKTSNHSKVLEEIIKNLIKTLP